MLNLLLLHGNSGYANASHCYPYTYIACPVTETECLLRGKGCLFYIYIKCGLHAASQVACGFVFTFYRTVQIWNG
jgi:hypothetical protein